MLPLSTDKNKHKQKEKKKKKPQINFTKKKIQKTELFAAAETNDL